MSLLALPACAVAVAQVSRSELQAGIMHWLNQCRVMVRCRSSVQTW